MVGPAQAVKCAHCGASVPLLGGASESCLYCLRETAVPPNVTQPLAEHTALRQQVAQALVDLRAARTSARGVILFALSLGVVVAIIAAIGMGGVVLAMRHLPVDAHAGASVILVGVVYFGLVVSFVGGALYARHHRRRRTASLPLASLAARQSLHAHCPSCGAALAAPADSIVGRCGACSTECLMPAPFVERRLQAQHRAAIELHVRLAHSQRLVLTSTQAMNRFAMICLMLTGLAAGVAYVVYFQIVPLPPHLVGTERTVASLAPGAILALFLALPAALGLRAQRKRIERARQPTPPASALQVAPLPPGSKLVFSRVHWAVRVFALVFIALSGLMWALPSLEEPSRANLPETLRMSAMGFFMLWPSVFFFVFVVQRVVSGGEVRTRIGLLLPLVSWRVRLPDHAHIACRAHQHRGQSGAVYTSHRVEVVGPHGERVLIASYPFRKQQRAQQTMYEASQLLQLPAKA